MIDFFWLIQYCGNSTECLLDDITKVPFIAFNKATLGTRVETTSRSLAPMKKFLFTVAALFSLLFVLWAGVRTYKAIVFGIECTGRMKRAADANTVELARAEMEKVVHYAMEQGLTNGYTSVIYRTPNEDIGFWFQNMQASLEELKRVRPDATQLEMSNVLMKLRETLLDHGGQIRVTVPFGISIFPHNVWYTVWGSLSFMFAAIFAVGAIAARRDWPGD